MRRWPVAVAVSVAAHVIVGLVSWAALSSTPAPSRPMPAPKPLDVLRVGALMPRVPGSASPSSPGSSAASTHVPSGSSALPRRLPSERSSPLDDALALSVARQEDASRNDSRGDETDARRDGRAPDEPAADLGASADHGVRRDALPGGEPSGSAADESDEAGRSDDAGQSGRPGGVSAGREGPVADLEAVTARVHARLAAAARDCYPAAARRFRQLGRVPVRFCVGANLAAERLVLSPSGLALLDDAARECVVPRAAPFPAEAATRCFEVAVDFGP